MFENELLGPPPLTPWQRTLLRDPDLPRRKREANKEWRNRPENVLRRQQYYQANRDRLNGMNIANNRARRAAMTPEQAEEERRQGREYKQKLRASQEGKERSSSAHKKWLETKGKEYSQRPEVKKARCKSASDYKERNWEKVKAYSRHRRATNPTAKLLGALRCRVQGFLKGNKSKKTMEYVGCTVEFLRAHLESQFLPHMNWSNQGHGRGKWQVDHIHALANIDPTDEAQIKRALHWSNLRPMWAIANIKKGKQNGKPMKQLHLIPFTPEAA